MRLKGWPAFDLDYFGQAVRVLQNPSARETVGFLNRTKYKAARRLVDKHGNTYLWDANDPALHALVAKELGLENEGLIGDVIGID